MYSTSLLETKVGFTSSTQKQSGNQLFESFQTSSTHESEKIKECRKANDLHFYFCKRPYCHCSRCTSSNSYCSHRWYTAVCLPEVFRKEAKVRSARHSAAPRYKAAQTCEFLDLLVQLLKHPPHSPDLAPCDFFLFPKVKEKIRG